MSSTLVILGASGDLTRRLLFPAFYRLEAAHKLPELDLIGYALEPWNAQTFQQHIEEGLRQFVEGFQARVFRRLARRMDYLSGDLSPKALGQLKEKLTGPALFYLALPPSAFGPAASGLGAAGLAEESAGWRRILIEKPFGTDLASAEQLNQTLHEYWKEEQIYRIDHFLGKETIQNLLIFRLANRFLEPAWGAPHIAQVQITAAETLGLEGRVAYYDHAGALRDMIQNHLMQLFALTALEPPSLLDPETLRGHKVEVLKAVRPIPEEELDRFAVRGQYGPGTVEGEKVVGYLEEPGIPPDSRTETYAALKLYVDNWRWTGVPFYLRSGKRLKSSLTEIALEFSRPPANLFRGTALEDHPGNWLVFRIKPKEEVELVTYAKEPGLELKTRSLHLQADYVRPGELQFSAYEQLLLDALNGNTAHFLRFDEVEAAWKIVSPVLEAWSSGRPEPYAAGSEGPAKARRILQAGHRWRPL